ncbi:hypothetical protein ACIGZI_32320 [Streptomyces griseus]|uniref:hypothetical protein n=1 Tax=Streptomyces griseus TaxID=1911 RepID=UPI0037CE4D90
MPPTLTLVITLALACLPVLYLLSVIRPTLRTFVLPKSFSTRQFLTVAALYLPGIGFSLLTGQYIQVGIQTTTAGLVLLIFAGAHRARRSAEADGTTAADPLTK